MGKKLNFTAIKNTAQDILDGKNTVVTPQPDSAVKPMTPPATPKPMKEKNGIVIDVPINDYMQLTMIKLQTGRTLKDLALQAIHEFIERNRVG